MSKKASLIAAIFITIVSIAVIVILHNILLDKTKEPVDVSEIPRESAVATTVRMEDNELVEVDTVEVPPMEEGMIYSGDLPDDLDVSQRNEYVQSLIDYDGISIDVTTDGFTLSDSFLWYDDTYWYDEDPEGFARYSYLYMPDYGDSGFSVKASDSLNSWVGANTDVTYCMTAALDTHQDGDTVTWYVVFRDYPDMLVKVYYNVKSDDFAYDRLF